MTPASGGTVALPSAQVVIPAAALSVPTTITLDQNPDVTGFTVSTSQTAGSNVYVFGPAGQTFNTPVTITLNYTPTNLTPIDIYLKVGGNWVAQGASCSAGVCTLSTNHFSEYIVGTTPTAPGAPTIGTATAGNAQATVTFTAPASNGGSAITGYTVTSSSTSSSTTPIITASGSTSPIILSSLTNGVSYVFTVKATNAIGTGASSTVSNSVTPIGVPGAVTNLYGTNGGGGPTIALFWSPPASNGGSSITGYNIYRGSSANGESFLTSVGNVSTYTDGNSLSMGLTYYYKISAINSVGEGPRSNETAASTAGHIY